tara:strand:+ start:4332 stop:6623 length:2292 start_codon:yes stop_codon:yes gene_type:complete
MRIVKKTFLASILIFVIFVIWFFIPMAVSINSVGKEYFLVDKSNISSYVQTKIASTIKKNNLAGVARYVKSSLSNTSRNKNSGEMVIFDPTLPIEKEQVRIDATKPLYQSNFQKKNIPNLNKIKNKGYSINTGGIPNERFYETYPSSKSLIAKNIQLIEIIDSAKFNGTMFTKDDPVQSSPLFHDGIMYFVTPENSLVAWDIEDKKIIFNLRFTRRPAPRGMALYQDEQSNEVTLYFNVSTYLVAVDAKTGRFKRDFGSNGYVRTGFGTVAPIVFNDMVITGINGPPSVVAVDRQTGSKIWRKVIDGGAPWAGISLDEKKGILFITTGNPKPPLYAAKRASDYKEANSIIAINAFNGEVIWSFQDVITDLWDFDIASPPALATTNYNDKLLDVVIAPTKRGNLIVANRETGELLEAPTYVRVPISNVPGEKTSPFQPLITFPEPFLDHAFKEQHLRKDIEFKDGFDINDFKFGFFETPSLKKPLITYGLHGGATWPGVSIDLNSNQLFVAVNKVPWKLRLFLQNSDLTENKTESHKGKDLYIKYCTSCHGDKRNGSYRTLGELEHEIVPSLVGIESTNSINILSDIELFKMKHKNLLDSIQSEQLNEITDYFKKNDDSLYKKNKIKLHYMWSMFIDESGIPINKPSYGDVVSYDLDTFKINWSIPVGNYSQYNGEGPTGQFLYGGMATTSDGVLFVTGGPDRYIRAYDTLNGENIWSYQMEAAGSSPPIVFKFEKDNYLAVIANGGKFAGYDKKSSNLYLFKF